MALTSTQASILNKLIDTATEGNWPQVAEQMLSTGWTAKEITAAAAALAAMADEYPLFNESDF